MELLFYLLILVAKVQHQVITEGMPTPYALYSLASHSNVKIYDGANDPITPNHFRLAMSFDKVTYI